MKPKEQNGETRLEKKWKANTKDKTMDHLNVKEIKMQTERDREMGNDDRWINTQIDKWLDR